MADKMADKFNCTGCGRCCTYGPYTGSMSADQEDIQRWEDAERYDILETAFFLYPNARTADLWRDPVTGDEVQGSCPWVRQVSKDMWHCTIHALRPNVCRNYPVSTEQRDEFGCPGYWDSEK